MTKPSPSEVDAVARVTGEALDYVSALYERNGCQPQDMLLLASSIVAVLGTDNADIARLAKVVQDVAEIMSASEQLRVSRRGGAA